MLYAEIIGLVQLWPWPWPGLEGWGPGLGTCSLVNIRADGVGTVSHRSCFSAQMRQAVQRADGERAPYIPRPVDEINGSKSKLLITVSLERSQVHEPRLSTCCSTSCMSGRTFGGPTNFFEYSYIAEHIAHPS